MSDHETRLRRRLALRTGLSVTLLEQASVVNFVRRRCHQLELPAPHAYWELLETDEEEVERLLHDIAVGETWLFRYPASYDLLVDHLRRLEGERGKAARLQMLSVACATGEEPYSMAIAALAAGWPAEQIRVDAVDRQEQSLRVARLGTYRRKALRAAPPTWAQPWLELTPDTVRVNSPLPSIVHFQRADVLSADFTPPARVYDVIFCRNLLIYLNSNARERLTDCLAKWLRPEGLLFVGHAEHVGVVRSHFCRLPQPHAFVLRPATREHPTAEPTIPPPAVTSEPFTARRAALVTGLPRADRPHPPRSKPVADSVPKPLATPATSDPPSLELAVGQANMGDLKQALTTLQLLVAQDSTDHLAHELLGNVHLALQQLDAARIAFEKVLYLHPNHTESLLQLALISERQGETIQAARYRHRAARAHRGTGVSHDTEL